jgi:predicted GNAT family acetyltransferase
LQAPLELYFCLAANKNACWCKVLSLTIQIVGLMKKVRPIITKEIVVNHDQAASEFFVDLSLLDLGLLDLGLLDLGLLDASLLGSGDERAALKYRMDGACSVDFYNTFVPRLARGRGIAEALVDAGLAWATEKNYEQRASCWYVQKHLST